MCWDSVCKHIFHFNRWESVKCFISGLGSLDLMHVLLVSFSILPSYFVLSF